MDFSWTEDQLTFREAVIKFAQKNLNHDNLEREKSGKFPRDLWRKCSKFGIQGLPFPKEYGGGDSDIMTTILTMEALGYGCMDQGLLFSIHAHMWSVMIPILNFGTAEQKRRYLPKLCDGTWLGAHGMSEPDSGSDAFSLRTTAVRKGDCYILNGTKTFVTNAPQADLLIVFATIDRKKGMWGLTTFLVDPNTKGCKVSKKIEKMGLNTSQMAQVYLDNCEVPKDNLLGGEGQGSVIFNNSMGWERSCILASSVGVMERQLETCIRYAKERKQFGKPIGTFQLISSKIADMKVRLETSRLLLYRTAWLIDRSKNSELNAAMTKLHISESAVQSGLDVIQIHGGYGYMKEYEVERDLRDLIGGKLYSGTSEMQRLIIARGLGLSPTD
jgi:alkylation response protein AidB-like acyl-CoA dehydrogenase